MDEVRGEQARVALLREVLEELGHHVAEFISEQTFTNMVLLVGAWSRAGQVLKETA